MKSSDMNTKDLKTEVCINSLKSHDFIDAERQYFELQSLLSI